MATPRPPVTSRRPDLERLRSAYDSLPGLRLSVNQASRLLAMDRPDCRRGLDALVDAGELQALPDGLYGRTERE